MVSCLNLRLPKRYSTNVLQGPNHRHACELLHHMLMGKALADIKENGLQEFAFSNLKFDKLSKQRGHYLITEYKKSLKNPEAGKMQLLFYIYLLKIGLNLKEVKGKLISGKTVIAIEDSAENFTKIEMVLGGIAALVNEPKPPKFSPQKICESCAYRDYCI